MISPKFITVVACLLIGVKSLGAGITVRVVQAGVKVSPKIL
jgi:hypothetical protein